MKARKTIGAAILLIAVVSATSVLWAQEIPAEYQQVLTITGKSGDYGANVLKFNVPRNDLHITVDKVALPTPFGRWFAMTNGDGGDDVVMGDLVLLQEEVNPIMSALLDNGFDVTALHNHFFWEEPRIYYMHVHGHRKAADLAKQIKPALDLIGKGSSSQTAAKPATAATTTMLDTAKIAKIVGHEGEQTAAVYQITIGRDDLKLKDMGATINSRMGMNTWAAFYGTNDNAAIAGWKRRSLRR